MAQPIIWVKNMETKQQIRKQGLRARSGMPQGQRRRYDSRICENLKAYVKERKGEFLQRGAYGYYPYGSEVNLTAFYTWLLQQKIPLAFPRVSGETMEFYRVLSMDAFETGAFGIREPVSGQKQAGLDQAFCFVPGSVFDRMGNRYGYGKGYYDRYLGGHPEMYRIRIAYGTQVREEILPERHDMKMHALVTEKGGYELCSY